MALLGAGSAHAATGYVSSGSVGILDGAARAKPTKVAVDDATGNVLVVDSSNNRVLVFDAGGPAAVLLAEFGSAELSAPYGIAIDQATHEVYVTDAGNNRIRRYDSDGLTPPTYTLDNGYSGPSPGSEAATGQVGSFSSSIAVDPRNGDLLIADTGNLHLSRFDAGGGFLWSIDGSSSTGAFQHPMDVAVDKDGTAYVVDGPGWDDFLNFNPPPFSRVERFDASGQPLGALGSAESVGRARSVAYDTASDNLVVGVQGDQEQVPSSLAVFNAGNLVTEASYPASSAPSAAPGVAVDGGSSGRLYGVTGLIFQNSRGTISLQVFDPILLPDVALDAPTAITPTTTHLSGTVNPLGQPATSYHFEYSSDRTNWISTPTEAAGEGEAPVPVGFDVTGLAPNTEYRVRLVAANGNGSLFATRDFSTAQSTPGVVTGIANDRSPDGITLHGSVNPFGLQASYYFEYGTTTSYGFRYPAGFDSVAGDGRVALPVARSISGLQPGTEYHYRLVGLNAIGKDVGEDRTFTTSSTTAPRVYEMVSPVDKGGSNIDIEGVANYQASPDGDKLVYAAKTALGGGQVSEAGPLTPKYASARGALDWSRPLGLDPPQASPKGPALPKAFTSFGVSEDNSKALVASLKQLAPGAVEGDSNLYLRDTTSGAYTTIGTSPTLGFVSQTGFSFPAYIDGTPDFSHVVFAAPSTVVAGQPCCSFLPGVPPGHIYEWAEGELRLVSVQADGTPLPDGGAPVEFREHDPHSISADGSRIIFRSGSEIYARIDGTTTILIGNGWLNGASRDGRYVFYSDGSLRRYDVDTEESTLIAPEVEPNEGTLQASSNGDYVYFKSRTALAPGAEDFQSNIYVWHDGQIAHIATLKEGRDFSPYEWKVSPNGRYFVFTSYSQLTDFDNSSNACQDIIGGDPGSACREAYRYDTETAELVCASCRLDGKKTTGNTRIGGLGAKAEFSHHYPRAMLDNGEVLFDTPDSLSAADTNSKRDVYAFDGQEARLISAGKGDGDSQFAESSVDGSNVFFTTNDQLVGRDTDTLTDVYDARIGGGLASQNPPPARGECIRDDCKATPNAGPELPFGGSEGLSGPGNVEAAAKKRCGKGRHARKVKGKSRCIKQHKRNNSRRQSR